MKITSTAFKENGIIPSRYTCEGEEINPPLHIDDVPSNAKSLVLIMDDPDVPKSLRADGMWDHWILFNILPSVQNIEENTTPVCKSGRTTSGHTRYEGPCPPDREHRYFFKLYALDIMINLATGATKKEVETAMSGHILAQCQLIGLYEKGKGY
jgi:Raf kinase inhibitor-like YbhB/YbcL family protein